MKKMNAKVFIVDSLFIVTPKPGCDPDEGLVDLAFGFSTEYKQYYSNDVKFTWLVSGENILKVREIFKDYIWFEQLLLCQASISFNKNITINNNAFNANDAWQVIICEEDENVKESISEPHPPTIGRCCCFHQ